MILTLAKWTLLIATLLIAVTLLALEGGSVAVVHTTDTDGNPRATRVWYVLTDREFLLEAGHPDNAWVQDLAHAKQLVITGTPQAGAYLFEARSDHAAHLRIRKLMRQKYGWRDWWVGRLFDTSQSSLIALRSAPPTN